ncbi:hypothetical protein Amn_11200 [Aminobacter sp. Y103A]|nr:hypothetical protein Amn_11200 [Aminobacter sp. SS-2016]
MSLLKEELSVPSIQEGAATRDGRGECGRADDREDQHIRQTGKTVADQCPPLGAHSTQVSKLHAETQDRHRRIRP